MAQQTGSQQETVADALARRVEARRGVASRWAEAFRELGAVDRARQRRHRAMGGQDPSGGDAG